MEKVDDYFSRKQKEMKSHCDPGMRIPQGDSLSDLLVRKEKLMREVSKISGSPEFERQKKEFARHVEDFKKYKQHKEAESCTPSGK